MAAKGQTAAAEPTPPPSSLAPPAKRVAKRYTPSQKAEIVEYATKHSVLEASKQFGASRFAIYDWQKRVAKAARGEGSSPTSGPSQSEIEEQRDREILGEWHKHRGLGPSQVKNQLGRRSIKVSVSTVRRVMENAGYRPPKVKRTPHDERYESVRPNHRWHLDFVHRHIHRANTFTLILIDDHSRFVVGHGVDDAERSATVVRTFEESVARHGKPERVMSDGGSAFWSWRGISKFTSLLSAQPRIVFVLVGGAQLADGDCAPGIFRPVARCHPDVRLPRTARTIGHKPRDEARSLELGRPIICRGAERRLNMRRRAEGIRA